MKERVLDGIINDELLSWKDKGILITLIRSREKGEKLTMSSMLELSSDGMTALRSGVNYLIEEGYLKRIYNGVIKHGTSVEYLVNEERFSGINE